MRRADNLRRVHQRRVIRVAEATTIGPYRVLEPLGRGGMGIVYRARHVNSERAIALKTVEVPASKWIDSIRREIQALTRIRHPGIVRIVDHGVHQGRPWYAMDLVEGESLRRFVQRLWSPYRRLTTPVPSTEQLGLTEEVSAEYAINEAAADESQRISGVGLPGKPPASAGDLTTVLQIMRRVCATLAFLHGEGFVNGDLKPENILLVDEQPVIIDFGLTSRHPGQSGREELEAQRGLSGTLPYMSPEQIRGEFLDARSDLYSVGCMLYELVTGVAPFTGAPRLIIKQHLSSVPAAPSEIVSGVSQELERLLLKLLEKNLTDRYGYADDVAAELAELGNDARRLSEFPPSRSYLYRPGFVGRDAIVTQLSALRDRAANGSGSLVLIGGESGVGKTRLAMELTRFVPITQMRVVTSEASTLAADSAAAVAPAPLHALRSLLQTIADQCQEGGPDVTAQLLGHRRSVLALYEPLLAHVPSNEPVATVMPLNAEASRQRLFKYLAETIAALVHEQPLMWVLDDLGWADELSLAFLKSLTADYFEAHPLFIVGAYRTEEPSEAIAAIAELPHVTHVTLPRLEQQAVRHMISDMLALREPLDGFCDFVANQAEGNPFFVAEYLRTAVSERLLHRDQRLTWLLRGQENDNSRDYESLSLPHSLLALIEHRLRKLSPAAHQVGLAAAVLGRESDIETLREVTALSEESSTGAIDELLRRQVLEQPEPESIRFAHDKLREVTYARAPAEQIRELHSRAATALEARAKDKEHANQLWATLGHHFVAAQQPEQAAKYLKLAADHAREIHANAEAIRLYQEAIRQVDQILLRLESDPEQWQETLIGLHESLGDVLALTARREEARAAYGEALVRLATERNADRARLHRKTGIAWGSEHKHQDALWSYESAKTTLGANAVHGPPSHCAEWIQVHIDQLWVHYWLNQVGAMHAVIKELRPLIDTQAAPIQKARFFQTQLLFSFRRDRYVVTGETLGYAEAAVRACQEGVLLEELPAARVAYGLALLCHGSIEAAVAELQACFSVAQRAGDCVQQARSLSYLALCARMRGRVEETCEFAKRTEEAASVACMLEYLGVARANKSWLALRRNDFEGARECAKQALQYWQRQFFPFEWLALLPLLEAELSLGNIDKAVDCARSLLNPSQQCLPRVAADALGNTVSLWDAGNRTTAQATLALALRELEQSGYV